MLAVRGGGVGSAGKGRAVCVGPQVCPSGSAQPAHSSSFSTGANTGMSPHVEGSLLTLGEKALQEDA